jgi:RNA polymerase sigma factor (sigma-70 family)
VGLLFSSSQSPGFRWRFTLGSTLAACSAGSQTNGSIFGKTFSQRARPGGTASMESQTDFSELHPTGPAEPTLRSGEIVLGGLATGEFSGLRSESLGDESVAGSSFAEEEGRNMKKASKSKLKAGDREQTLKPVEESINQQAPLLAQHVQREMAYFLATGELIPDVIQVESVVDEAVIRALSECEQRPPDLPFDQWLATIASDVLDRRVRQLQTLEEAATSEESRMEQRLSRVPPAQKGAAVEDEMYDWYQPDENMHMEDIVADPHTPSPEEIIANRQLQQDLDQMIALLPKRWRDVFVLHCIEDFTLEQVSLVTGQVLDEVQQDLRSAREFLRERLMAIRVALPATDAGRLAGQR